jgi:hypothetical protein
MSSPIQPTHAYVAERNRLFFTAEVRDETGALIPGSSLATLTLTLYLYGDPKTIINSRSAQSVKNANGGTTYDTIQTWTDEDNVAHEFNFKMVFSAEDNAHVGAYPAERHVAVFRWTYDTTGQGSFTILINILDEPKVGA